MPTPLSLLLLLLGTIASAQSLPAAIELGIDDPDDPFQQPPGSAIHVRPVEPDRALSSWCQLSESCVAVAFELASRLAGTAHLELADRVDPQASAGRGTGAGKILEVVDLPLDGAMPVRVDFAFRRWVAGDEGTTQIQFRTDSGGTVARALATIDGPSAPEPDATAQRVPGPDADFRAHPPQQRFLLDAWIWQDPAATTEFVVEPGPVIRKLQNNEVVATGDYRQPIWLLWATWVPGS